MQWITVCLCVYVTKILVLFIWSLLLLLLQCETLCPLVYNCLQNESVFGNKKRYKKNK